MHEIAACAGVLVDCDLRAIDALLLPDCTQRISEWVITDARYVTDICALPRRRQTKIRSITTEPKGVFSGLAGNRAHLPHGFTEA